MGEHRDINLHSGRSMDRYDVDVRTMSKTAGRQRGSTADK